MLQQDKYIIDILNQACVSSYKPVDTFISTSNVTMVLDCLFSDPTWFHQIVGALQYVTFIRLYNCFVVNKVCQFMHAPTYTYWVDVKRILRYLQGTFSFGLHITCSSSFALHGFTYANCAGSVDDRKSTSGYLVFFVNTPVS